jgi:hypothetical protein
MHSQRSSGDSHRAKDQRMTTTALRSAFELGLDLILDGLRKLREAP